MGEIQAVMRQASAPSPPPLPSEPSFDRRPSCARSQPRSRFSRCWTTREPPPGDPTRSPRCAEMRWSGAPLSRSTARAMAAPPRKKMRGCGGGRARPAALSCEAARLTRRTHNSSRDGLIAGARLTCSSTRRTTWRCRLLRPICTQSHTNLGHSRLILAHRRPRGAARVGGVGPEAHRNVGRGAAEARACLGLADRPALASCDCDHTPTLSRAQVKLRSFTTRIHRVDACVSYKADA